MFISDFARQSPEKPALVNARTGEVVTYAELDASSNQLAHFLHSSGLRRGDHIALLMENHMRYLEVVWAALRSGLYVTPINRYLTADEVAYIADNCDAKALVLSDRYADIAAALGDRLPKCSVRLLVGQATAGWEDYDRAVSGQPSSPLESQWLGEFMFYSSGTTGRPNGIKRPLRDVLIDETEPPMASRLAWYGFDSSSVFLTMAPMYHAAPLAFAVGTQQLGGTVVMQERFDAEEALALIQRYRVTHSQWVPTMFIRLLRLPEERRLAYDLSSLKAAIHAAAPCPVDVKASMIAWWGDRIHEYYGASEQIGVTYISAKEWLERPGSVGRARVGVPHICNDEGEELGFGQIGQIYFSNEGRTFEYHKNPEKTAAARHPTNPHWLTTGDIGYLDEGGYLFITGRKAFTIISGGVNIYPQAIEDALVSHEKVNDAAVFGIPDAEYGESVKAVIELAPGVVPDDQVAEELRAYLRKKIAAYMVPKHMEFIPMLPRLPTGKLHKQALIDDQRARALEGMTECPTVQKPRSE